MPVSKSPKLVAGECADEVRAPRTGWLAAVCFFPGLRECQQVCPFLGGGHYVYECVPGGKGHALS